VSERVPGTSPHRPGRSDGGAVGQSYEYVVVDDDTHVIYTRPLCLKAEAVDASRMFKAAAEGESGKNL
jgi:hypothetical protein